MSTLEFKNRWITRGAWFSALAVALGAFGAHILKTKITPEYLETFKTATQYQFFHGIALVLFGIWSELTKRPDRIGWFLFVGTVLFSGSLYLLVLTGIKAFGIITPLGGVLLITGWVLFARASK